MIKFVDVDGVSVAGTRGYIAPEGVISKRLDQPCKFVFVSSYFISFMISNFVADVWALGVTLFDVITLFSDRTVNTHPTIVAGLMNLPLQSEKHCLFKPDPIICNRVADLLLKMMHGIVCLYYSALKTSLTLKIRIDAPARRPTCVAALAELDEIFNN